MVNVSEKTKHTAGEQLHVSTFHARDKNRDMKDRSVVDNKKYYDPARPPKLFETWLSKSKSYCGGAFVGYNHDVAICHNLTVNSTLAIGNRGGEDFRTLFNQDTDKEILKFEKGFMKLFCDRVPSHKFREKGLENNLNRLMMAMKVHKVSLGYTKIIKKHYVAVLR